jgi:hypothetical protein
LFFITEVECVYSAVRTESLYNRDTFRLWRVNIEEKSSNKLRRHLQIHTFLIQTRTTHLIHHSLREKDNTLQQKIYKQGTTISWYSQAVSKELPTFFLFLTFLTCFVVFSLQQSFKNIFKNFHTFAIFTCLYSQDYRLLLCIYFYIMANAKHWYLNPSTTVCIVCFWCPCINW